MDQQQHGVTAPMGVPTRQFTRRYMIKASLGTALVGLLATLAGPTAIMAAHGPHPDGDDPEAICPPTDESQPVERYDGTLGVTQAFVAAHQGAVGQLQWNADLAARYRNPGSIAGRRWCSGTLIADDLFLTAGHCFDPGPGVPLVDGTNTPIPATEIATNMRVNFNYQVDPNGSPRREQSFAVRALVEYRRSGLDYAIVQLDGAPGRTFGVARLAPDDAAIGDSVCIIGHPAGERKQVEAGRVSDLDGAQIRYADIDTRGGNSGSGILHELTGTLVGVHTNGGCGSHGYNHGQRIGSLRAASPTLTRLTAPERAVTDLLFYDRTAGLGAFRATDGRGNIGGLAEHAGWRRSWTHIVPGRFGGNAFTDLLFYDAADGLLAFRTTDGQGNIGGLAEHTDRRATWSQIIPGDFSGSGHTDLLFYEAATGLLVFRAIDGRGGLTDLAAHAAWRRGWTHIIPGDFGGTGYTDLLFYDAMTGIGEFHATGAGGGLTLLRRQTAWRRNWTQIVPGRFGGTGHTDLLFYDAAVGHGEFYITDGRGNLALLRRDTTWRRTWSQIVPGNFTGSGRTDLLFYDAAAGHGEFYATDGDNAASQTLLRRFSGWRTSWAQIIAGDYA